MFHIQLWSADFFDRFQWQAWEQWILSSNVDMQQEAQNHVYIQLFDVDFLI